MCKRVEEMSLILTHAFTKIENKNIFIKSKYYYRHKNPIKQ